MADFVNDYSNLAGAGAAFQGFAQGFQNAQDQNMKKMEFTAKMKAMQSQQDRDTQELALKKRMAGVQDSTTNPGQLEDAPPSLREQNKESIEIQKAGLNPPELDETGHVKKMTWNPASPPVIASHAKTIAADTRAGQFDKRISSKEQLQAENTFNKDPLMNQYLPRVDGATKILKLIQGARGGDFKSTQAMLGQLNAEISRLETGSQSVALGSSEKTEMKDAAAKYHDIYDTLSGNVTGVDLSKKFDQAEGMVKDLGSSILSNIHDRGDFLKSGGTDNQSSVYDAKIKALERIYGDRFAKGQQYAAPAQSQAEAPPQQSHGFLSGLVSKGAGLLGLGAQSQPAQAQAPAIDPVTQAKIQRLNELKAKAAGVK